MATWEATMGKDPHPRDPDRRSMITVAEHLDFGHTVELGTPSWEPSMEFAVQDGSDQYDESIRLIGWNGSVYRIRFGESGNDGRVPRLYDESDRSRGVVTELVVTGDVAPDQDHWEGVWS